MCIHFFKNNIKKQAKNKQTNKHALCSMGLTSLDFTLWKKSLKILQLLHWLWISIFFYSDAHHLVFKVHKLISVVRIILVRKTPSTFSLNIIIFPPFTKFTHNVSPQHAQDRPPCCTKFTLPILRPWEAAEVCMTYATTLLHVNQT